MQFVLAATVFFVSLLVTTANAQSSTEPPQGQHAILSVLGRGVQMYTCQQANGTLQWVFQAPEATLYDAGSAKVGTHGAGPAWTYKDGSSVKGEVVKKSAAPEPGAIPWLLLKASGVDGNGLLSKVEFIRRFDTHGGEASTVGCDVQHLNSISRIPYAATYTFYSAKP
ncbi:MAG: hypothetical protein JWP98_157 [Edaphobacter sp.]|nr:hypothetical protein [Edaphobacter sp.]